MERRNPPLIHDAMSARPSLAVAVRAAPAFELLIGLYAVGTPDEHRGDRWAPASVADCPPRSRRALERLGARAGELWLHVLGLALDLDDATATSLIDAFAGIDPVELRRYVVGADVPAWRDVVGAATLEEAARGDGRATAKLLTAPHYYAGRARDALERLLAIPPAELNAVLVEAVASFYDEVFRPLEHDLTAELDAEAAARRRLGESSTAEALIDAAACGYLYERETGIDRVVLIPQLAARPWLLLCQHRTARVICYGIPDHPGDGADARGERLLAVGRALADAKRVRILERLREGDASLQELSDELGLARSTTHHHIRQLRTARLIVLKGNAQGYRYALDPGGFVAAEELLRLFV